MGVPPCSNTIVQASGMKPVQEVRGQNLTFALVSWYSEMFSLSHSSAAMCNSFQCLFLQHVYSTLAGHRAGSKGPLKVDLGSWYLDLGT